jgi:hypothetical protein
MYVMRTCDPKFYMCATAQKSCATLARPLPTRLRRCRCADQLRSANATLDERHCRAHRDRLCEGKVSPGGRTLASHYSSRVRRLQPCTSVPSPSTPMDTAYPCGSLDGPCRLCQRSHRPSCAHTCSQARPPPQLRWAAWSRTSRRWSAPPPTPLLRSRRPSPQHGRIAVKSAVLVGGSVCARTLCTWI